MIDLYILYFLEKCQNISPPHLCEKCLSPESNQIVGDFFVPGGETRGGQSDLKRAYTRNAGPYRPLTFVVPALSLLALVERMFTSLSSSSSYCCIFALMYFCIIELSHCCMVVRMCCCIVVSLYCCKVVSLYHCSVALLYQSIVVYLYCCIAVLLYCLPLTSFSVSLLCLQVFMAFSTLNTTQYLMNTQTVLKTFKIF